MGVALVRIQSGAPFSMSITLAINIWEDGALAKWSLAYCAELMQCSVPGQCPMCHQRYVEARCAFGCHTTEVTAAQLPINLIDLMVALTLADSKSDARRLIKGGSVKVNDVPVRDPNLVMLTTDSFITHAQTIDLLPWEAGDFLLKAALRDNGSIAPWLHIRVGKQWPWLIRASHD